MKKYLLVFLIIINAFILGQTTSEKYDQAMDAYHSKEYAQAVKLFDKYFKNNSIYDELYSSAKYYQSDAYLNLGIFNSALVGFNYLVDNYVWSNFRDKSLYKLGSNLF